MLGEFAPLLLNPEFDGVALGLITLVVGLVLLGLLHSMQNWLVPLVSSITNTGGSIFDRVLNWAIGKITAGVRWVVKEIAHFLSVALAGVEAAVGLFFHDLARLIESTYGEVADFAVRTAEALWTLTWETVPRLIREAVAPVARLAREAWIWTRALEAGAVALGFSSVHALLKWLHAGVVAFDRAESWALHEGYAGVAGFLSRVKTWLDKLSTWEKLAASLGFYGVYELLRYLHRAVAVTIPAEIGRLEVDLKSWLKYKDKLLALLTESGMALAVIAALTKLLGFDPFCRNNRNILKNTCGLDSALLDLLLAGLVDIALVADVAALAELAITATEDSMSVIESIAGE